MRKSLKVFKTSFFYLALMFFIVSFLGWSLEKIYCKYYLRYNSDRGFLLLPFCGLYGFVVLILYCYLGTIKKGKLIFLLNKTINKTSNKIVVYLTLYFIISTLIASLIELFVAIFFDFIFNINLWSYSYSNYNFYGYICINTSIIWGILCTVFMNLIWDKIFSLIKKIPIKYVSIIVVSIIILIFLDYTFNMTYLIKFKEHFDFI